MSLSLTATPPTPRRRSRIPRFDVLGVRAVELLLRPERFFRFNLRHHAELSPPFILIWLVGANGILDSLASRAVMSDAVGRSSFSANMGWVATWAMAVFGGLIAGPVALWIRGWWFRVRLRFCGADDASPEEARFVWLYATSAYAVPSLLLTLLATPVYPNLSALLLSNAVPLTSLGLMLWAVWVGYRGAVACFPVRRGRAVFWFLILPSLWFLGQVGGVLLASLASS